jgi:hypothetical protein
MSMSVISPASPINKRNSSQLNDPSNVEGSISTAILDVSSPPSSSSKRSRISSNTPVSSSVYKSNLNSMLNRLETVSSQLKFSSECQKLAIDLLMHLLNKIIDCEDKLHVDCRENEQLWIATCLWLAANATINNHSIGSNNRSTNDSVDSFRSPSKPHISYNPSLTALVNTLSISLTQFTKHLAHSLAHFKLYQPSLFPQSLVQNVEIFENFLTSSVAVHQKFEKIFKLLFPGKLEALRQHYSKENPKKRDILAEFTESRYYGTIWNLYLAAKNEFQLFGQDSDMYCMYITLLCTVKLALESLGTPSEEALNSVCKIAGKDGQTIDSDLQSSVKHMFITRFDLFLSEMAEKSIVLANSGKEKSDSQENLHYSSIFSPENLLENARRLGLYLDKQNYTSNEALFWLDERIFLQTNYNKGNNGHVGGNSAPGSAASSLSSHLYASIEEEKVHRRAHRRLFMEPSEEAPSSSANLAPNLSTSNNPAVPSQFLAVPSANFAIPSSPLLPVGSNSGSTPHRRAEKSAQSASELAFSPVMRSPNYPSIAAPPTPISRMMETVAWINNRFKNVKNEPSTALRQLLASQDPDPTQKICNMIENLANSVVFPENSAEAVTFRRELALKLYYHVLENMLVTEKARLEAQQNASSVKGLQFSSWLLSKSFHASVLAVCFEIVLHSYKLHTLSFGVILRQFGLKYWDCIKVIESTVKNLNFTNNSEIGGNISNNSVPTAIKTHLRDLENSILEYTAWKEGETLAQLINLPQYKKAVEIGMKPEAVAIQPRPNSISTITDSPAANSSANFNIIKPASDANSSALLLFYRKLFSLVADRLSYLCSLSQLNTSTELEESCWWLTCYIMLTQQQLIINRHIDTIILCSIYTILVKVAKIQVDFKRIITLYLSRWEQNNGVVVREVYSEPDCPPVNIISWYNKYFIHTIRDYAVGTIKPRLNQIQAQIQGELEHRHTASSPLQLLKITPTLNSLTPQHATAMPRRNSSSPHKLMSNSNIYLSPLKYQHIFSNPHHNQVYSIGNSPSKELQRINQLVSTGAQALKKPKNIFESSEMNDLDNIAAAAAIQR